MKHYLLPFSLAVLVFVTSCDSSRKDYLPSYSGQQGELIVVVDPDIKNSALSEPVYEALNQPLFGLPQFESMFKIVDMVPKSFTSIFKTHRSILHLRIDSSLTEGKVQTLKNTHAQMQSVVIMSAPDLKSFQALIDERLEQVLWHFHKNELTRINSRNRAFGDKDLNNRLEESIGLKINTQKDMEVAEEGEDFVWLRLDREKPLGGYQHQISQGILIYWKDYTDTASFNDSALIDWKNRTNEKYVPGPQNSHMTTSFKLYEPAVNYITFQGETAKEIRGLWRMEGYFMGGPFYALSFYNPQNGRQYMIEGYVFAPQFDKRPFLREVEAICKGVKPLEPEAN